MDAFSKRNWRATVVVAIGVATVALVGSSFAQAATAARGASHAKTDAREGIVQSVGAKLIVLRELDGTTVSIPVAASTRVFVDGKRASLHDVRAGFVASVGWTKGKAARVLQAFNLLSQHPLTVGLVDSVSTGVLMVKESGGTKLSIPVNVRTRVFIDGKPGKLAAVKRGYTVVISARDSKGDRPAHELRFLRPV
jgi:hypothetical protein